MDLFAIVGGWFNASPTVGMWLVIGFAVLLVGIIVLAVISAKRKKHVNLDFEDFDTAKRKKNKEENVENTEPEEEFITLKTNEQFEQAKIKKVVATANEDVSYEKAKSEPIVKEQETSSKDKVIKPVKPATKKEDLPQEKQGVVENKQAKKLNGKWVVEHKGENEYLSKLLASNGEVMLTSEIYTTVEGAKGGILTIIRGVESGKFVIYQDKNNNHYYKLKTSSNRLLCVGEIYKVKEQCLKAVESVKRIAASSTILNEVFEGARYIDYTPAPLVNEVKKGARGKWKIEKTDGGAYSAKLYANNGQLMLATEEVSQKKGAENALVSVKKYAEQGNFIIDKDKFGRFYYKLRNLQKSVICIGEAYDTLESCVSAIESVRKFALSATVPGENE